MTIATSGAPCIGRINTCSIATPPPNERINVAVKAGQNDQPCSIKAQQMNATTYRTVDIFSIVLVMYFALALLITIGMQQLERIAARGLARGRGH